MNKIEEYEFDEEEYDLTSEDIKTLNNIFNRCTNYSMYVKEGKENGN